MSTMARHTAAVIAIFVVVNLVSIGDEFCSSVEDVSVSNLKEVLLLNYNCCWSVGKDLKSIMFRHDYLMEANYVGKCLFIVRTTELTQTSSALFHYGHLL